MKQSWGMGKKSHISTENNKQKQKGTWKTCAHLIWQTVLKPVLLGMCYIQDTTLCLNQWECISVAFYQGEVASTFAAIPADHYFSTLLCGQAMPLSEVKSLREANAILEWDMLPSIPLLELLFWCHHFKSGYWNSFEDSLFINFIIFKWVTMVPATVWEDTMIVNPALTARK